MNTSNITEAISYIHTTQHIDFDKSFALSKICSECLRNGQNEHKGRELVIRILDAWNKVDPNTRRLWNDLVEVAGLYPYVKNNILTGPALLRYEYHKSKYLDQVYFHEDQMKVAFKLLSEKSVVLSAPTSFGKSLLIDEIVASKKYLNIVIIQPTLALLDETRKRLQKYGSSYKILVSTAQLPSQNRGNIFLFTPERVVEYHSFNLVDFFIVDEFYKLSLSRDDERALVLNHAFYKLLKFTKKFYLLGPMVQSIPENFKKSYDLEWFHTKFSTVAIDEIRVNHFREKTKEKENILFDLLIQLEDPTLVYCSSPQKVTDLAGNFLKYLSTNKKSIDNKKVSLNNDMIVWLNENIHPSWVLIESLRKSIAFHHGALPRHLGSSIVDAFNKGGIRYLFCTSTLIEGVNTTAKNVVLFDRRKGLKPIDFFDYRNITGRSGRMKIHYIGRVFKFYSEPEQMELDIDIPILTQHDAPLELLIQIDDKELSSESKKKLEGISGLEGDLREIIRLNSGLPVEAQLKLLKIIEDNLTDFNKSLQWRHHPTYGQLLAVLDLAWHYLLRPRESKGGIKSPSQLAFYTLRYLNIKSIPAMINMTLEDKYWLENEPELADRVNKVVFTVLNVARHWFDYKLPNLLRSVSNLQKYIFLKHKLPYGDYLYLASELESGFVSPNLAALLEFDIPPSAIKKLEPSFRTEVDTELILSKLRKINLDSLGLNKYELNKIKSLIS